jgi:hypothetical protein
VTTAQGSTRGYSKIRKFPRVASPFRVYFVDTSRGGAMLGPGQEIFDLIFLAFDYKFYGAVLLILNPTR